MYKMTSQMKIYTNFYNYLLILKRGIKQFAQYGVISTY